MNAELKRKMLRDMIRCRAFDIISKDIFVTGSMPGWLHMYLGEEACGVGVCAALTTEDYIFSTHRGHGHLIAKGADMKLMMAELYGKVTGYNKGRGGSMHIAAPEIGILGANGIVGGGIPLAAGSAFTSKYKKDGKVSVCFFGDGASNEGTFHETLNLAAAFGLPVIYVCENNYYGMHTPLKDISKSANIADRAYGYGMPGIIVDGNDVLAVYEAATEAVARARAGLGPTLIECKTYRWDPHCVGKPDLRPKDERARWIAAEPIKRFENVLLAEKLITPEEVQQMWDEANAEVWAAVKFAEESPEPLAETALDDVYSD